MMRRIALVSLAVVLVLAIVSVASARDNIADTYKKGSLLVFPKIVTSTADGLDTYVFLGNDNTAPVSVKCYWMDNNQTIEDFQFTMTANQPVYFSALKGQAQDPVDTTILVPPFIDSVGALVCFAVDAGGTKSIQWNHLYGSAMIVNAVPATRAVLYNAYSFAAPGDPTTSPGTISLNNVQYDACPQYLVANFLAADNSSSLNSGTGGGVILGAYERPDLTLWPCKQDLRQDRQATCTKAKFDVWSENEIKFTGAYQCLKCWYEGFLDDMGRKAAAPPYVSGNGDPSQKGNGFGWDKFVEHYLGSEIGRFRVQGIVSSVCSFRAPWNAAPYCTASNMVATPFLGLLIYGQEFPPVGGSTPPVKFQNNAKLVNAITGVTLFGPSTHAAPDGAILWDISGGTPEAPAQ